MNGKRVPMTVTGAKRLQEELDRLKSVERPQVIEAIAEARALGDLSENAEYESAKHRQSLIEGRIVEIEAKLAMAEIIDPKDVDAGDRVVFGATLELLNLDTDARVFYQIVGEDEADLKEGKVSVSSPVGRAMIGKSVGEEVDVETPAGRHTYEILSVRYD